VLNKCLPSVAPNETLLKSTLGNETTERLLEKFKFQEGLKKKIQNEKPFRLAAIEVLGYSATSLDKERLKQVGQEICKSWDALDPTFFSKK
jgi:hypothetical protein